MIQVEVFRVRNSNAEQVGVITWDGNKLTPVPEDAATLHAMLSKPVNTEDGVFSPEDQPEEWIKNLHRMYHGSYLWAGKAGELATEEGLE